MKKTFLLAAAAALLLASCGKNEVFVPVQEDIPIGFNNYAPRSITKADGSHVDTGALPTGSKIGVYGYSTEAVNLATGFTTAPVFMTDAVVDYGANTSATATASDPVRYWPKTVTNLLSFFAYYPQESTNISGKPTASTAGMGTFTFTQEGAVADMQDFMISNVANDQYYWATGETENPNGVKATNGVVPLVFNHMLTKVNFAFRTAADYSASNVKVTVNSASIAKETLSETVITPSFTAKPAGQLGTTSFSYSSSTAYGADITIPFAAAGQELTVSPALNNGTAGTDTDFLFVPQVLSDDVKVTINYTIEQDGTTTVNTATVQLNQITDSALNPIDEWDINDFITYTFIIGLKEILFTGSVTDWDTMIAGSYVIQ